MILSVRLGVHIYMQSSNRPCAIVRLCRQLALFLAPILLAACGGLQLEDYRGDSPRFNPHEFFIGNTHAWGIVQDWRGRIVRRFDVSIAGHLEGTELHLDEHFRYADGERSSRYWRLAFGENGEIVGTADDIVGNATGATQGNAMRWRYAMDIPVAERSYRVHFDDWLWQLDKDVLMNRSYVRKFGIVVAEVTIFMQKVEG